MTEELRERLGFWIEKRSGIDVLVEKGGGCHPANQQEKALVSEVERLEAENERLEGKLAEIRTEIEGEHEGYVDVIGNIVYDD